MKKSEPMSMMWTCTTSQESQWSRRTNFARIRCALQEVDAEARLVYGCPVQAIVHVFGLDERTVAEWRDRAGQYCQRVHEAMVGQGQLDLVHVQVDEIRVKGRKTIAWMGLAIMVSTRLWLDGTVSMSRDKRLADALPLLTFTLPEGCMLLTRAVYLYANRQGEMKC